MESKTKMIRLGMVALVISLFAVSFISAQPIIDSEVLDALDDNEWVPVIVDIKDITNITVSYKDSIEVQNAKDEERKRILGNITDSILNTLSEDEFKLESKSLLGNAFYGKINKKGLEKLKDNPDVGKIFFDGTLYTSLSESRPLINSDGVENNLGYNGTGNTICVIDSGINYTHSAFGNCPQTNNISDGSCPKIIGGHNYFGNNSNPMDYIGHGTHVAGIIASQNETYKGIAPGARLVALKACSIIGCSSSDIKKSLTWCYSNRNKYNITIVSMSLGDGVGHPLGCSVGEHFADDEINQLYSVGVPIVVASGNDGYGMGINYPACHYNTTSVGANYDDDLGSITKCTDTFLGLWCTESCTDLTTYAEKMACWGNRGFGLDILAPGCDITSAYFNGSFADNCGTSMSAPHVSGTIALMLEKNSTLNISEINSALTFVGVENCTFDYCENFGVDCTGTLFPNLDALVALNNVPFNNCSCTNWTIGACGAGNCSFFQRQNTTTCTPSGCDVEEKCEYDETCITGSGGDILTVCKGGGCNYTTIQDALDDATTNDMIEITDNGTYEEDLYWTATGDYVLLDCKGATISPWSFGIRVENGEDKWAIINCIFNGSVGLIVNGTSGTTYEILNSVFDVEEKGIKFDGDFSSIYIEDDVFVNADEEGVYFTGIGLDTAGNGVIERNTFSNNLYALRLKYSQWNQIYDNVFEDNTRGIYLRANGNDLENYIQDNNISNNDYGIYIYNQDGLEIYNNYFCPSNSVYDIYTTNMYDSIGGGNTCEKPDGWSDSGTSGCTYYCDTGAEVNLLYPNDNSTYTTKGNITLVCQAEDNSNLVNVTLYHNISGTWQANQTKNISGTSNITVFTLSNIPTGTNFIWNCLAYDNKSRGGFADANFTVEIIVDNIPPNVNINSPLNQTYETSSIDFNVTLNENGICKYSLDNGVTNITMGTTDNRNFTATNSSMNDGAYLVNFYCQDGVGNMNDSEKVYFSVDVPIPPNDTHKFRIDMSGEVVAWFGSEGNIVLKGKCYSGGSCDNPGPDSFIIRNITNDNVAYINSTGDLCVTKGDCSDQSANCNSTRDGFMMKNSSDNNMVYLDYDGDLCLTGKLYENSNP